jgi:acyl carrier protein
MSPSNPLSSHSDLFEQLRDIIAEQINDDPANITPDSDLAEDLGMEVETDLPPIINRINKEFSKPEEEIFVRLNPKQIVAEAETVNDILTLIIDEVELG